MIYKLFREPQKCKKYVNQNVKGWFVEPKINGVRGIVIVKNHKIISLSRNNKPLYNTEVIQQAILKSGVDNVVLDGEFYISQSPNNNDWSMTVSTVKTQSEHFFRDSLKFHIFDLIPIANWTSEYYPIPLLQRKNVLKSWIKKINHISVVNVPHESILEILDVYLDHYLSLGFEGGVIKDPSSVYNCGKRSPSWLKLKKIHTEEYPIIRIQEGLGKYIGTTGAIIINVNGVEVGVGTGMIDNERDAIWKDKDTLAGLMLEVSYQTKSKDGSLIFPVFNRIRYDLV